MNGASAGQRNDRLQPACGNAGSDGYPCADNPALVETQVITLNQAGQTRPERYARMVKTQPEQTVGSKPEHLCGLRMQMHLVSCCLLRTLDRDKASRRIPLPRSPGVNGKFPLGTITYRCGTVTHIQCNAEDNLGYHMGSNSCPPKRTRELRRIVHLKTAVSFEDFNWLHFSHCRYQSWCTPTAFHAICGCSLGFFNGPDCIATV